MGTTFSIVVVGAFFVWIVCVAVDLEVPAFLAKWYREPGNSVRAMTWVGSLFIVLITLTSRVDSFLSSLRNDAISIAIAVIVLEELGRYRTDLEEKERLIRQMASHSNDFALDAVRQVIENGWYKDGSVRKRRFSGAQLRNADLREADLQDADATFADLRGAKLVNANLQRVNFAGAKLQHANMPGANLRGANLWEANLQGANLMEANLRGACLEDADLQGVYLEAANLQGANLKRTNLQHAWLGDAKLRGVKYETETIWPEDFDPKAAGAILVEWNYYKEEWVPVEDTTERQANNA